MSTAPDDDALGPGTVYDFNDWNPVGEGRFEEYVRENLRLAFAQLRRGRWVRYNMEDGAVVEWHSELDEGEDASFVTIVPSDLQMALSAAWNISREDGESPDEWLARTLQPWRDAMSEVETWVRKSRGQ